MRSLQESPSAKESVIRKEQTIAEHNGEVKSFVERFHFDADREAALERFLASPLPVDVLAAIRYHFGFRKESLRVCEVGAGDGFLAIAMVRAGYKLDVLEPSDEFVTGTGFLQTRPEAGVIRIFNNLDTWYADPSEYDLILTNACIHHFDNPHVIATQVRMKVAEGGLWLAFSEFCAYDVEDTLTQLNNHRHAVLYGLYEWPYSPSLYAAQLEAAGFRRAEMMPVARVPIIRAAWSVFRAFHLTWPVHLLVTSTMLRLCRRWIRAIDPLYMAFRAVPIRWSFVNKGYSGSDSGG